MGRDEGGGKGERCTGDGGRVEVELRREFVQGGPCRFDHGAFRDQPQRDATIGRNARNAGGHVPVRSSVNSRGH